MEFCYLELIFSQVEDPKFENFLGENAPDPLNGLGLMIELNLGLEKSGNFILSGNGNPATNNYPHGITVLEHAQCLTVIRATFILSD